MKAASIMLTGKIAGRKPLGRSRLRWKYDIRMELKEMGVIMRECVD